MKSWNLQDAKARLSELVDRARLGDAQVILRRGKPAAVLIAYEAFEREQPTAQSVLSFLQRGPLGDADFAVLRSVEPMRELE